MILAALVLWLVAAESTLVLREAIFVPPGQIGEVGLPTEDLPAIVECSFRVGGDGPPVRLALFGPSTGEAVEDESEEVLRMTPYGRTGGFRHLVSAPGRYWLVVDNRSGSREAAHVYVLATAEAADTSRHQLPPEEKAFVVIVSLALFAVVAVWAGCRVREAFKRRNTGSQHPPFS